MNAHLNRCFSCMQLVDTKDAVCPHCGYDNHDRQNGPGYLPEVLLYHQYQIGKMLGRGGFGVTYMGYDLNLMRRVAIKEYFPRDLSSRDSQNVSLTAYSDCAEAFQNGCERALRESRVAAALGRIPGIVQVYNAVTANNTIYIVMEYVEGQTLSAYVQEHGGKLSFEEALALLGPIAEALGRLHEAGVVHRDVKPDNIMVRRGSKETVLLDFGAARVLSNETMSLSSQIYTMGYAPPEQCATGAAIDARLDEYAFSATLYYALTGQTPMDCQLRLFTSKDMPPIHTQNDSVSSAAEAVIMKGMALKMEERYATMAELLQELKASGSKRGGKQGSVPVQEAKPKEKKKSHSKAAVAAVCTAIVVGGAVWAGTRWMGDGMLPIIAPVVTESPIPTVTVAPMPTPTPKLPVIAPVSTENPMPTVTVPPTSALPALAPVSTEDPMPTIKATLIPTSLPELSAEAVESAVASNLITFETVFEGTKKSTEYVRDEKSGYNMGDQSNYLLLDFGVTTFRGSNFRQNAASGNVSRLPSAMSVAWTQEAGSVEGSSCSYYGIGWTGQPAIIKWSKEVRETTSIVENKRNVTDLKEVILAGLDGKIYFLDLADGVPTRDAIDVGYPMKGSVSVSSYGMPIMTVGQYARKMASGTGDIGLRFFNLLTQKQIYLLDGLDDRAVGVEGSFDTAALFDRTNDGLVVAGTNGMLYTIDMNTEYDAKMGSISIDPEEQLLVAKASGQKSKTVQVLSSMAMYSHYAYYADMTGILHCVDTDTMKTVWAVELGDAVQAAVSLDFDEDGTLWVYTANTLQNRSKGTCDIRRFNAMTGEEGWALSVGVTKGDSSAIPGAMASPVLGEGSIDHLAIFTLSKLSSEPGISVTAEAPGAVVAVNKQTGTVEWTYALNAYTYSSPVAVYTESGEARIIQCDNDGNIYLLDGLTGSLVSTLKVEGNIEGSPAVYMDTMVVGTTGKNTSYIYGITLQ
mgnify:CR=1 FL=1